GVPPRGGEPAFAGVGRGRLGVTYASPEPVVDVARLWQMRAGDGVPDIIGAAAGTEQRAKEILATCLHRMLRLVLPPPRPRSPRPCCACSPSSPGCRCPPRGCPSWS